MLEHFMRAILSPDINLVIPHLNLCEPNLQHPLCTRALLIYSLYPPAKESLTRDTVCRAMLNRSIGL
jgi:hypothetical protein